jgi:thiamine-monophosphate kinase
MPRSFSEDTFLSSLFPQLKTSSKVLVGPGDDCAVYDVNGSRQVIGVDQVIEGRHYLPDTPPELVGRKLLARNLSDIAAMGAVPKYAVVASASSQSKSADWLQNFHQGLLDLADEFGVLLIGGDLASTAVESVASLTIIGEAQESVILRKGASAGDLFFATGQFGNSFESEHHLNFSPRVDEGQWLCTFGVSAMMDVTDGLLQDATKLSQASSVHLILEESKIILREGAGLQAAMTDGEDYELIFSVAPDRVGALIKAWPFNVELTNLGYFSQELDFHGPSNTLGEDLVLKYGKGYDHFEEL